MSGWETATAGVDLLVGGRTRMLIRDPCDGTEVGATGKSVGRSLHVDLGRRPDHPRLIEREFERFQNDDVTFNNRSKIDTNSSQFKNALPSRDNPIPAGLPYSGRDG